MRSTRILGALLALASASAACSRPAPAGDAVADAPAADAPAADAPVTTTAAAAGAATDSAASMVVYKSPTCGCCNGWVDHVKQNGFAVAAHDVDDMSEVKASYGVPAALESCHTAMVGGYVIEGHVPADVIRKLLAEKPAVVGIAAPGMPAGSPGMEMPGTPPDHYDIIAWDKQGHTRVYAKR